MPNLVASFNVGAPVPIDKRMVKKNIAERNSIPMGERFEGLDVYCEEEQRSYKLKGGIDDDCWTDPLSDLEKNMHHHDNKDILDNITQDVVDRAEKSEQSENKGKKGGYASLDESGKVPDKEVPQTIARVEELRKKICGYTWFMDADFVQDSKGEYCGSLEECMAEEKFIGNWFYAVTTESDAGEATYPEKYVIDGANGHLSLRDYVIWTGDRLVHIPTFEAKSSTEKNSDGKYSPKSGVDGLMSSTDKAYLTDLINAVWGKEKMTVFPTPDPTDGWMVNWCREDGIYLGGIKKDCGGHPPVVNDNHTSWVLMVFNGMATDTNLNRNHRLQVAFDVVNSKIYMRRGWISDNSWAESWDEVGGGESQEITFHEEEALLNWVSKTGVHFCRAQAGNGANPVKDDNNLDYIIYAGKVFDGSNYTSKRFQEAVHVASGRTFYRRGEVAEGGSFGGFEWTEIKKSGSDTLVIEEVGGSYEIGDYKNIVVRLAKTPKSSDYVILNLPNEKDKVLSFNVVIYYPRSTAVDFEVKIHAGETVGRVKTHVYDGSTYCTCFNDGTEWLANMMILTRNGTAATASGEEV